MWHMLYVIQKYCLEKMNNCMTRYEHRNHSYCHCTATIFESLKNLFLSIGLLEFPVFIYSFICIM